MQTSNQGMRSNRLSSVVTDLPGTDPRSPLSPIRTDSAICPHPAAKNDSPFVNCLTALPNERMQPEKQTRSWKPCGSMWPFGSPSATFRVHNVLGSAESTMPVVCGSGYGGPMTDDLILDLDAFIRSIGINRASQHALLLGAGSSISSGIPSAASCIWEWKRAIFLTRNPGLETQFAELSLPAVRSKIQRWLDGQRVYPPNDSPEEYSAYIIECYPIADDRRAFFQDKVRQAVPHTGYRLTV